MSGPCTFSGFTEMSIIITWSDAVGESYFIVWNENSNSFIKKVSAPANSWTFTGLTGGTNYTFSVTVYGIRGQQGNKISCSGTTGMIMAPAVISAECCRVMIICVLGVSICANLYTKRNPLIVSRDT